MDENDRTDEEHDVDSEEEYDDSLDGDHETALESVYGPSEDSYLDNSWEDQYEIEYDGGDY